MLLFEDLKVVENAAESDGSLPEFDVAKLNISQRSRVSRLPWKGQFSPELVDYFLDLFATPNALVVDPFSGSGTVLFECMSRNIRSVGIDANPAAYLLSKGSSFAKLGRTERTELMREASALLTACPDISSSIEDDTLPKSLVNFNESFDSENVKLLVAIALMLGVGDKKVPTRRLVQKGLALASTFVNDLPESSVSTEAFLGDARYLPDACANVDLIVTSPPYINVFNYHQNYRPVLELLGWQPLKAASTEIGANRKHRQNRLLTVIQYCVDMQMAFEEMGKVLKTGAKLVLVVGRSSAVLGNTFYNADLLENLLQSGSMFNVESRSTRMFKNRFGVEIFEEVIVASRLRHVVSDIEVAKKIAVKALNVALMTASEQSTVLLEEAIQFSPKIAPSPRLALQSPLK